MSYPQLYTYTPVFRAFRPQKKPCLRGKEGFFATQTSLVRSAGKPSFESGRSWRRQPSRSLALTTDRRTVHRHPLHNALKAPLYLPYTHISPPLQVITAC